MKNIYKVHIGMYMLINIPFISMCLYKNMGKSASVKGENSVVKNCEVAINTSILGWWERQLA